MQAMHVEELQKANTHLQQQLNRAHQDGKRELAEKDATITDLSRRLEEAESQVQQLLDAAQERDSAVLKIEKKARLFYEVVEHRSTIARILDVLEELSIKEDEESDNNESRNGVERTADQHVSGREEKCGEGQSEGISGSVHICNSELSFGQDQVNTRTSDSNIMNDPLKESLKDSTMPHSSTGVKHSESDSNITA